MSSQCLPEIVPSPGMVRNSLSGIPPQDQTVAHIRRKFIPRAVVPVTMSSIFIEGTAERKPSGKPSAFEPLLFLRLNLMVLHQGLLFLF
jgi:hypothetical protein